MTMRARSFFRAAAAVLLALVAGCSSSDSDSTTVTATIGAMGGTIEITTGDRAGTRLTIPPGALPNERTFMLQRTTPSSVPDALAVGPATFFSPTGFAFDADVTLTLVYDEGDVPAGTTDDQFVVKQRDPDGRIVEATVTAVNRTAETVTATVRTLGSFWVAVRTNGPALDLTEYWPLDVLNRWEFDNDLTLTILQSSIQPNIQGPVTVLSVVGNAIEQGLYVDRVGGTTTMFGRFAAGVDSFQELHDMALIFVPDAAALGEITATTSDFSRFQPIGDDVPDFTGTESMTAVVRSQGSLDLGALDFDDVLEVEIRSERGGPGLASIVSTYRLWLARGIGPVMAEWPDFPLEGRIVFAQVDGDVVVP